MRPALALLVFVTLLDLWPRDALAQASEAALDPRDEEARSLFEAGRIAYGDGRYEDAREHFERSYQLSGRPELLYNIASADDRLRHDEAAAREFEQYLAEVPDAENRDEVEGRLEALRAAIAARTTTAEAPSEEPRTTSGPTVLFTWIAAGAAVITGGMAIGFWVAANDQYAALDRGCLAMGGGCTPAEVSASGVEMSITLTNVFLVSSLVLAAASLVILPIELTLGSGPDTVMARLRVGPGSLGIEGTF